MAISGVWKAWQDRWNRAHGLSWAVSFVASKLLLSWFAPKMWSFVATSWTLQWQLCGALPECVSSWASSGFLGEVVGCRCPGRLAPGPAYGKSPWFELTGAGIGFATTLDCGKKLSPGQCTLCVCDRYIVHSSMVNRINDRSIPATFSISELLTVWLRSKPSLTAKPVAGRKGWQWGRPSQQKFFHSKLWLFLSHQAKQLVTKENFTQWTKAVEVYPSPYFLATKLQGVFFPRTDHLTMPGLWSEMHSETVWWDGPVCRPVGRPKMGDLIVGDPKKPTSCEERPKSSGGDAEQRPQGATV